MNDIAIQTLLHATQDKFHLNEHVADIHAHVNMPPIAIGIKSSVDITNNFSTRLYSPFDVYQTRDFQERLQTFGSNRDGNTACEESVNILKIEDKDASTNYVIKGLKKHEKPVIGNHFCLYSTGAPNYGNISGGHQ